MNELTQADVDREAARLRSQWLQEWGVNPAWHCQHGYDPEKFFELRKRLLAERMLPGTRANREDGQ